MFRKCLMALMLIFTVAGVAACTSHPDDKGDVTGKEEYMRKN